MICNIRQKFLIVFVRVVDGVEEVFKVVKSDQSDLVGLWILGLECYCRKAKYDEKKRNAAFCNGACVLEIAQLEKNQRGEEKMEKKNCAQGNL